MPRLIKPVTPVLSNPRANSLFLKELKTKRSVLLDTIGNNKLYKIDDSIVLLDAKEKKILFNVTLETKKFKKLKVDGRYYSMFWVDPIISESNIPSLVFDNHLFPETEDPNNIFAVTSAVAQTELSQGFMLARITALFDNATFFVYYYDSSANTLERLTSVEQLDAKKPEIWGDGDSFQDKHIVMTKTELSLS